MRVSIIAAAAAAALASTAFAAKPESNNTAAASMGPILGTRAPTGLSTGFESPFVTGTINGQQGWTVSQIGSPAVPVTTANIVNTTPISGAQSLRLTDTTAVASGTSTGAFSPVLAQIAPDQSISTFSARIDGVTPGPSGGADYFISGQSPAQLFVTWRIDLNFQGPIRVLDFPGVGQTGTLGFQNTTASWTPGTVMNFEVDFLPLPGATPGTPTSTPPGNGLGTIVYKLNGVPIYTADSLVAGTSVDQFVFLSDNFQVAGESGTFDNLGVTGVPEPTSLALLGLGALATLRRRRA